MEPRYRVTVHLIDGKKFKVWTLENQQTVDRIYDEMGGPGGGGRMRFLSGPDTWQIVHLKSVLSHRSQAGLVVEIHIGLAIFFGIVCYVAGVLSREWL